MAILHRYRGLLAGIIACLHAWLLPYYLLTNTGEVVQAQCYLSSLPPEEINKVGGSVETYPFLTQRTDPYCIFGPGEGVTRMRPVSSQVTSEERWISGTRCWRTYPNVELNGRELFYDRQITASRATDGGYQSCFVNDRLDKFRKAFKMQMQWEGEQRPSVCFSPTKGMNTCKTTARKGGNVLFTAAEVGQSTLPGRDDATQYRQFYTDQSTDANSLSSWMTTASCAAGGFDWFVPVPHYRYSETQTSTSFDDGTRTNEEQLVKYQRLQALFGLYPDYLHVFGKHANRFLSDACNSMSFASSENAVRSGCPASVTTDFPNFALFLDTNQNPVPNRKFDASYASASAWKLWRRYFTSPYVGLDSYDAINNAADVTLPTSSQSFCRASQPDTEYEGWSVQNGHFTQVFARHALCERWSRPCDCHANFTGAACEYCAPSKFGTDARDLTAYSINSIQETVGNVQPYFDPSFVYVRNCWNSEHRSVGTRPPGSDIVYEYAGCTYFRRCMQHTGSYSTEQDMRNACQAENDSGTPICQIFYWDGFATRPYCSWKDTINPQAYVSYSSLGGYSDWRAVLHNGHYPFQHCEFCYQNFVDVTANAFSRFALPVFTFGTATIPTDPVCNNCPAGDINYCNHGFCKDAIFQSNSYSFGGCTCDANWRGARCDVTDCSVASAAGFGTCPSSSPHGSWIVLDGLDATVGYSGLLAGLQSTHPCIQYWRTTTGSTGNAVFTTVLPGSLTSRPIFACASAVNRQSVSDAVCNVGYPTEIITSGAGVRHKKFVKSGPPLPNGDLTTPCASVSVSACQAGWKGSGGQCNIPSCELRQSCTSSGGSCIGPNICKCADPNLVDQLNCDVQSGCTPGWTMSNGGLCNVPDCPLCVTNLSPSAASCGAISWNRKEAMLIKMTGPVNIKLGSNGEQVDFDQVCSQFNPSFSFASSAQIVDSLSTVLSSQEKRVTGKGWVSDDSSALYEFQNGCNSLATFAKSSTTASQAKNAAGGSFWCYGIRTVIPPSQKLIDSFIVEVGQITFEMQPASTCVGNEQWAQFPSRPICTCTVPNLSNATGRCDPRFDCASGWKTPTDPLSPYCVASGCASSYCLEPVCASCISGQGVCQLDRTCQCLVSNVTGLPMYRGPSCAEPVCPQECKPAGTCGPNGKCICLDGISSSNNANGACDVCSDKTQQPLPTTALSSRSEVFLLALLNSSDVVLNDNLILNLRSIYPVDLASSAPAGFDLVDTISLCNQFKAVLSTPEEVATHVSIGAYPSGEEYNGLNGPSLAGFMTEGPIGLISTSSSTSSSKHLVTLPSLAEIFPVKYATDENSLGRYPDVCPGIGASWATVEQFRQWTESHPLPSARGPWWHRFGWLADDADNVYRTTWDKSWSSCSLPSSGTSQTYSAIVESRPNNGSALTIFCYGKKPAEHEPTFTVNTVNFRVVAYREKRNECPNIQVWSALPTVPVGIWCTGVRPSDATLTGGRNEILLNNYVWRIYPFRQASSAVSRKWSAFTQAPVQPCRLCKRLAQNVLSNSTLAVKRVNHLFGLERTSEFEGRFVAVLAGNTYIVYRRTAYRVHNDDASLVYRGTYCPILSIGETYLATQFRNTDTLMLRTGVLTIVDALSTDLPSILTASSFGICNTTRSMASDVSLPFDMRLLDGHYFKLDMTYDSLLPATDPVTAKDVVYVVMNSRLFRIRDGTCRAASDRVLPVRLTRGERMILISHLKVANTLAPLFQAGQFVSQYQIDSFCNADSTPFHPTIVVDRIARIDPRYEAHVIVKGRAYGIHDLSTQCPAVSLPDYSTEWKCLLPDTDRRINRLDKNGDVQCASYDGRECMTAGNVVTSCSQGLALVATAAQQGLLRPLTCGRGHAVQWVESGYNIPGLWCNTAYRTLRTVGKTPIPDGFDFSTPWSCTPMSTFATRLDVNGDVQCASLDAATCLSPTSCNVANTDTVPASSNLKPLTCGRQYELLFNTTGYSILNHWCVVVWTYHYDRDDRSTSLPVPSDLVPDNTRPVPDETSTKPLISSSPFSLVSLTHRAVTLHRFLSQYDYWNQVRYPAIATTAAGQFDFKPFAGQFVELISGRFVYVSMDAKRTYSYQIADCPGGTGSIAYGQLVKNKVGIPYMSATETIKFADLLDSALLCGRAHFAPYRGKIVKAGVDTSANDMFVYVTPDATETFRVGTGTECGFHLGSYAWPRIFGSVVLEPLLTAGQINVMPHLSFFANGQTINLSRLLQICSDISNWKYDQENPTHPNVLTKAPYRSIAGQIVLDSCMADGGNFVGVFQSRCISSRQYAYIPLNGVHPQYHELGSTVCSGLSSCSSMIPDDVSLFMPFRFEVATATPGNYRNLYLVASSSVLNEINEQAKRGRYAGQSVRLIPSEKVAIVSSDGLYTFELNDCGQCLAACAALTSSTTVRRTLAESTLPAQSRLPWSLLLLTFPSLAKTVCDQVAQFYYPLAIVSQESNWLPFQFSPFYSTLCLENYFVRFPLQFGNNDTSLGVFYIAKRRAHYVPPTLSCPNKMGASVRTNETLTSFVRMSISNHAEIGFWTLDPLLYSSTPSAIPSRFLITDLPQWSDICTSRAFTTRPVDGSIYGRNSRHEDLIDQRSSADSGSFIVQTGGNVLRSFAEGSGQYWGQDSRDQCCADSNGRCVSFETLTQCQTYLDTGGSLTVGTSGANGIVSSDQESNLCSSYRQASAYPSEFASGTEYQVVSGECSFV